MQKYILKGTAAAKLLQLQYTLYDLHFIVHPYSIANINIRWAADLADRALTTYLWWLIL